MSLDISCIFDIRSYRRSFTHPLVTSHGRWSVREGAIVRLSADGRVGYGELAPIPWFGSETLGEALDYCSGFKTPVCYGDVRAIPESLPATQFALETAWCEVMAQQADSTDGGACGTVSAIPLCGLLPSGEAALHAWQPILDRGYTTLKWKIGVGDRSTELEVLRRLRTAVPSHIALRLDANGGLDWQGAVEWLQACDRLMIEFVEQPLPPQEFAALLALSRDFVTQIALDESVATLRDLRRCLERGWPGVVVIKPAICGFPTQVQQICSEYHLDVVVSSALESPVGQRASLALASSLQTHRALGFGVDHWLQPVPHPWPACLWQT